MDLQALNSGTVATKNFLNPVCGHVTAGNVTTDILTANTVDFKTIETNSLTLVSQVAVPNPAVGSQTIFVDSGNGLLSAQDSLGNTVPYLPTTGGTMTGAIDFKNNVTLGAFMDHSVTTNNVLVGQGNCSAAAANCVALGSNIIAVNGTGCVAIGHGAQVPQAGSDSTIAIGDSSIGLGTFNVAIGRAAITGGSDGIAIGLGANAGSGAGTRNISLGESARSGIGAGVNDAIAIGYGTNNSISSSCQIGDPAIIHIRPANVSTCDLGTTLAPFKTAWLRDAAPASGCKFSQFDNVTVTNTVVETSLSTGTQVGSLVASAGASLGTVYRFKLGCTWTGTVGDSATFRFKTNGAPLIAIVLGPSNSVTEATTIIGEVVVSSGGNAHCSVDYTIDGLIEGMARATSAYNPAVVNTFDASVQWSAADPGDVLVVNFFYVETLYAQ